MWKPKSPTEIKYRKALQRLIKSIEKLFCDKDDAFDILRVIKSVGSSRSFKDYCFNAAKQMVTLTKVDNAKNWREAAKKSSKGKIIYQNLINELKNPIISSSFYEQIANNASLINSLPLDISQDLTKYVASETFKGKRASDIADDLKKKFPKIATYRANLIARTEVSKTNTALTQARCQEIGLGWYIWKTSEDARVRSSHKHMDGVLIKWSNPPNPEKLAGENKSFGSYDAGSIFNCRCYPEPLIEINSINWPCKVYLNGSIKRLTKKQFENLNNPVIHLNQPLPAQHAYNSL